MPNAWGTSFGGDTGAWGVSWGSGSEAPPEPPPVVVPTPVPGGHPFYELPRYKKPKQREITRIINEVARRQVETLEADSQKRFEELERELESRQIEWESRHLEALNERRELLIEQEIGRLLRQKIKNQKDDEEALIALLMSIL